MKRKVLGSKSRKGDTLKENLINDSDASLCGSSRNSSCGSNSSDEKSSGVSRIAKNALSRRRARRAEKAMEKTMETRTERQPTNVEISVIVEEATCAERPSSYNVNETRSRHSSMNQQRQQEQQEQQEQQHQQHSPISVPIQEVTVVDTTPSNISHTFAPHPAHKECDASTEPSPDTESLTVDTFDRPYSEYQKPPKAKQSFYSFDDVDTAPTERSSVVSVGSISTVDIASYCSMGSTERSSAVLPTTKNVPKNAPKNHHPYARKFRMKVKKEDVQATNDGYASVKKLSQWLDNDPFEKKKPRPTRKGNNILKKSRVFEPDQPSPVARELENICGNVSERRSWLKGAFEKQEDCEEEIAEGEMPTRASRMSVEPEESVSERAKWLREDAFHKNELHAELTASRARAEEIQVKAAVSDRAKWLQQEAFKKKDEVERPKSVDPSLRGSVSDRAKWLKEEAFKKREVAKANKSGSTLLPVPDTGLDMVPWDDVSGGYEIDDHIEEGHGEDDSCQERSASVTNEGDTEEQRMSVSERAKWLREEAFRKKQLEAEERPSRNEATIERGSVSDRAKWLKDEAFKKANAVAIRDKEPVPPPPVVADPNTMTPVPPKKLNPSPKPSPYPKKSPNEINASRDNNKKHVSPPPPLPYSFKKESERRNDTIINSSDTEEFDSSPKSNMYFRKSSYDDADDNSSVSVPTVTNIHNVSPNLNCYSRKSLDRETENERDVVSKENNNNNVRTGTNIESFTSPSPYIRKSTVREDSNIQEHTKKPDAAPKPSPFLRKSGERLTVREDSNNQEQTKKPDAAPKPSPFMRKSGERLYTRKSHESTHTRNSADSPLVKSSDSPFVKSSDSPFVKSSDSPFPKMKKDITRHPSPYARKLSASPTKPMPYTRRTSESPPKSRHCPVPRSSPVKQHPGNTTRSHIPPSHATNTRSSVKDVIGSLNKTTKTQQPKPKTAVQLRREQLENKQKVSGGNAAAIGKSTPKKTSWAVNGTGSYVKKVQGDVGPAPRKSFNDLP
eukprot:CAMPEP_0172488766 /NCGR_PEP_ID=MMETSP1066-20121228/18486_1 /TAXON_ID=671091 /ORGANISM="Coscinodiscus wailesii, Strain CCMP2513" /LENGTH=1016 /DNA_ID=CAMNT_0013256221 /DNA_START=281 /DNA_END=3331 /DNA_ORIENTATION=+